MHLHDGEFLCKMDSSVSSAARVIPPSVSSMPFILFPHLMAQARITTPCPRPVSQHEETQSKNTVRTKMLAASILVLCLSPLALGSTENLDPVGQDTSPARPLILAYVVSGSEGDADGIYTCMDPMRPCVHVQKPLLRLDQEASPETAHSRREVQPITRRKIVSGTDPVYEETWRQIGKHLTDEDGQDGSWVWVNSATEPPRDALSLHIVPVGDKGCPQDARKKTENWQEGKGPDANTSEAIKLRDEDLGDVYRHLERFSMSAACYGSALRTAGLSEQQQCSIRLALCGVSAAARKADRAIGGIGGGDGGAHLRQTLKSEQQTQEVGCLSALLLRQEGEEAETPCKSMTGDDTVAQAHLTVGVSRMCDEWDVGEALKHFSAAAGDKMVRKAVLAREENRDGGERFADGDVVEWGAVWLAQAIQGRSDEASSGFVANATVFGEAWAGTHLQTWRRHLSRKCSGLGMSSVIEGAERLVLAGVRAITIEASHASRNRGELAFVTAEIVDHHLTLSRALLLQGAFEEARGHARAAQRLEATAAPEQADENREERELNGGGGGDGGRNGDLNTTPGQPVSAKSATAALLLEILLLSRTPVVLETEKSALLLRKELMVDLERLQTSATMFGGSISTPMDVGVRAQFLFTYQGLDDKVLASTLARVFDLASGGALSYYPPHLVSKRFPEDFADLGHNDRAATPSHRSGSKTVQTTLRLTDSLPKADEAIAAESQSSEVHEVAGGGAVPTPDDVKPNRVVTRVGFLSAHFRWHSVGRLTVALLEELSASSALQIFVIDASHGSRRSGEVGQPGPADWNTPRGDSDERSIMERLAAAGASIVRIAEAAAVEGVLVMPSEPSDAATRLPGWTDKPREIQHGGAGYHRLHTTRETVAALELDVLVYGDVGMDALTTALAYSRLSPVQVAFWGHPGTTGLPTVDYFVTSDLFEADLGAGERDSRARTSHGDCITTDNRHSQKHREDTEHEGEAGLAGGEDLGRPGAWAWSEVGGRQDAYSEQLVRLGGLGFLFDDPMRTFRWDPIEKDSSDEPQKGATSRETRFDVGKSLEEGGKARAKGYQNLQRSGGGRIGGAPPPSPSTRGAAAAAAYSEVAAQSAKAADPNRPRVYVCAQSLMKMHPAFDAVLAGILATDPLAQVVLLRDSRQLLWHSRFRRRLRAAVDAAERRAITRLDAAASSTTAPTGSAIGNGTGAGAGAGASTPPSQSRQPGEFWSRVRFVSPLSATEFFRLQCRADVVLDPFPFGGGVTTLEALACGTPVVTAGALQSVHRLAEGMIAAAAAAATECQDSAEYSRELHVDEAGSPPARVNRVNTSTRNPELVAEQQRDRQKEIADTNWAGDDRNERATAGRHTNNTCSHHFCGDRSIGSRTEKREGGDDLDAGGETRQTSHTADDGDVLVVNLVAETPSEYVRKAVAVAAPGAQKERVRRALRCGRDGMLKGGGGDVARDWEVFLTRIAA